MSIDLHIERRAFADRIANLGFAAPIPRDWIAHELPDDPPNFANSTELFPLAMVTPQHSAIVLAFMARPAFDDGTVHQWAMYLLSAHGMRPRAISIGTLGSLPAIVGEAVQDSEIGTVVVRFAFCEDGGRLINVSLAAPEMLAPTVTSLWFEIVREFALDTPLGATTAIRPGAEPGSVESGAGPGASEPTAVSAVATDEEEGEEDVATPPDTGQGDDVEYDVEVGPSYDLADEDDGDPEVQVWFEADDDNPPVGETPASSGDEEDVDPHTVFAEVALAADIATLDPEHPINANLRNRGVGLVPNVIHEDRDRSYATIAAPAIGAFVNVPFGWHAIDDGRRTLVFDPVNDVQVNLSLLARERRTVQEVLDAIEAEAQSEYPDPRFIRLGSEHIQALGVGNIHDGGHPLEQYHLVVTSPDPNSLLRARSTSSPERGEMAANLAEAILTTAQFAVSDGGGSSSEATDSSAADSHGRSDWWIRAVELEREGRLDDAAATIEGAVNHLGAYASVAQLFADRMIRLQDEGDRDGAADAYQRARKAIIFYASLATSGGEGLALSYDRDQFLARLEQSYRGERVPAADV